MTTDTTTTLLVTKAIFINPISTLVLAGNSFLATPALTFNYGGTADTLCWGSFSYGLVYILLFSFKPI